MTTIDDVRTEQALSVEIQNGVAIITFDLPNESVNKFNRAVKDEFVAVLESIERDSAVTGAVVISGKPDVFIAGADIEEFLEIRTEADAERLSRDGQAMLDRLAALRVPIVAAIHGACLGGGLEMVLACPYRIATEHPKTVLALPEVQLGLIPGAGGTQRLPRMVGLRNALDMILRGKNVRAKKALQIGLIDEMVHPAILRDVAIDRARQLGDGKIKRQRRRRGHGAADTVLESRIGRSVVFRQARQQTLSSTKGKYPAPLAAIDAVRAGYELGTERGYKEEARLFGRMAVTEVSRQLIFLFFATSALKKDQGVDHGAPEPRAIDKIGVLGSGFMGAGIAGVAAMNDTLVRLKDTDHARIASGLKAVHEVLRERLVKKAISRTAFEDQLAMVGGTIDYSGFGNVDLVIEAVFEDLSVKQDVLREAEQHVPSSAIFATNTSTIPIARIAEVARRPDKVIGMHFFSPVHKMPLLEVIPAKRTSAETIVSVVAYGKRLGKTVIVVNDAPGFYANRVLAPYINEAGKLLDDGVPVEAIDAALVDFGFPVGPITLIDEVGLDVAGKAGQVMYDAFGERMKPSTSLQRVVEAGRTGRKGKKGFYLYDEKGKKGGVDESVYELLPAGARRADISADDIQRRTILAMVNEAARCLEEGILRAPHHGDVGAVFGIGFPPFRGGPFRYIDTIGPAVIVHQLEDLHVRYSPRFEPADSLVQMARQGKRYYPRTGKPVQ
ncbi:MAG TPA: fatty acid oxidation complex subunit alpha FadJ [Gemmatimonadaceae bacterium]|nr:fatty acid oxidation complex subunit alpha FadJ [Gemmatimonadaceae bacterium]